MDLIKSLIPSIVLILLGVWAFLAPKSLWYLNYGWMNGSEEASDSILLYIRIGGIVAIILGVLLFVF